MGARLSVGCRAGRSDEDDVESCGSVVLCDEMARSARTLHLVSWASLVFQHGSLGLIRHAGMVFCLLSGDTLWGGGVALVCRIIDGCGLRFSYLG